MAFLDQFLSRFRRIDRVDDLVEEIEIPDVMFTTNRLRQRGFYDAILLTLTKQPLQQVDSAVTKGVGCSRELSNAVAFYTFSEIF